MGRKTDPITDKGLRDISCHSRSMKDWEELPVCLYLIAERLRPRTD